VNRAYEILCTARVMGRANEEMSREERRTAPAGGNGGSPFDQVKATPSSEGARVRMLLRDALTPPERLVFVEMLLLRYELDSPLDLLGGGAEDRNLSCSLNVTWPDPTIEGLDRDESRKTLSALTAAMKAATKAARPQSTQARSDAGRFDGWLIYGSAQQTDKAFQALLGSLHARGLGVRQTIRDLTLSRI
jgi:hypothetical protein